MNKYTTIQFFRRKGYFEVVVFYSKNSLRFRESTKVQVRFEHLNTGKKGKQISKAHPDYEADLDRIKFVQDRVESIITSYVSIHKSKPDADWVRKEYDLQILNAHQLATGLPSSASRAVLTTPVGLASVHPSEDVFVFWKDFIAAKAKILREPEESLKPYNSSKYCLEKFREKRNYKLSFGMLDQDFFNDLTSYLVNEHESTISPDSATSLPDIGLQNGTAIKRIKNFKEYLAFCVIEEKIVLNIPRIDSYIRNAKRVHGVKELGKSQNWELSLTVDEIEFTVNLPCYEADFWNSLSPNQKRYIDIFIFMCLQGTAPVDTKSMCKLDIRDGMIIKERSKTGNDFKVELDPISEEILIRNNYNLDFTEQTLNDEIKRLFTTILELYRPHYEKRYGRTYKVIERQKRKKGDQVVWEIKHRALFVECMTGRRSFITNLCAKADEMGIKAAMDMAGHVKISTTLGYIHSQQLPESRERSLFGITKVAA
jgi:hypothetical protein